MIAMLRRLRSWIARLRAVRSTYRNAHDRAPRLLRPVLYSEKMQWRKLFGMQPIFTSLSDKLAVRGFIAARGLEHLLVPLLWSGTAAEAIPFGHLPRPFIIKSTHASGHVFIALAGTDIDQAAAIAQTNAWLADDYGSRLNEPGYLAVPRQLIIETLLAGAKNNPPAEYNIFVFAGRVQIVQLKVPNPAGGMETNFFSPSWKPLPWRSKSPPIDQPVPVPEMLGDLISAAETLGAGFDHVRVDFYECDGRIFIGEISLYPWSGLGGLYPRAADREMGAFWTIQRPLRRALQAFLFSSWGEADQR